MWKLRRLFRRIIGRPISPVAKFHIHVWACDACIRSRKLYRIKDNMSPMAAEIEELIRKACREVREKK